MSLANVIDAVQGHNEKEKDRAKVQQIITWEAIRWQTWILYNLQVKKKDRLSNPNKLLRLDWEQEKKQITQEDWEEINKRHPDKLRWPSEEKY